ncbi:hypothetical protein N9A08_12780 [Arthrobacter koreensis]|uniref:Uncharacterized protein n=1 Tax=Arthrobacter koreensis TaxID=199136 RepID=A0ABY6FRN9_9MICC|nr:hypothetical protein [Arthrobacter koreensis]UYB35492.1 hypothetical protein N9A08_12780 [Arthrobacter koreensis]
MDMWNDDDWRGLTGNAQGLYLKLLTHPTLTYCGVADWRPGRLAKLTMSMTAQDVIEGAKELQAAAFAYVDEETEEIFLRSFVRHDGLLKHPRLSISMAKDFAAVASPRVRGFFVWELKKMFSEEPELKLWSDRRLQTILKGRSEDMKEFCRTSCQGEVKGLGQGLAQGFAMDDPKGLANPMAKVLPCDSMPTTTATTTSSKEDTSSSEIADAIFRPDVEALLGRLEARVQENGFRAPARTKKNQDAARLLLDRDRYTVEDITAIIDWATSNEFWRTNIRSMSKLREKIETLKAQATRTQPQSVRADTPVDPNKVLGADYWTPGTPPEGLSVDQEVLWAKEQRARHQEERVAEAKRRLQRV